MAWSLSLPDIILRNHRPVPPFGKLLPAKLSQAMKPATRIRANTAAVVTPIEGGYSFRGLAGDLAG
jgi:hypothetical protein